MTADNLTTALSAMRDCAANIHPGNVSAYAEAMTAIRAVEAEIEKMTDSPKHQSSAQANIEWLKAVNQTLKSDLERATESRKQAQNDLYDARERFQKELLRRTGEVSRLLKEREDCEPFGYFRPEPFGWTDCAPDDDGSIPLYAAPPKREPLSDEQIAQILRDRPEDAQWSLNRYSTSPFFSWDFLEGFRAAERAHGIGGQS